MVLQDCPPPPKNSISHFGWDKEVFREEVEWMDRATKYWTFV